jgi:phage antirepressor YoqD-like protein
MRGGSELMRSVIKVDGHKFKNVTEMAEFLGVKRVTVFQYMYRHPEMSPEAIYHYYKTHKKAAKYVIEGKEFYTIKEVAKYFNIGQRTLASFLHRHNNSMEDAYNFYKNRNVYGFRYNSYLIDGMEFFSHKDIADYLGITIKQFQNYMYDHNGSIELAYYHFKNKRLQEEKHESKEYQH